MAPFRGSFIPRLTFCTDPPIFRIAATRKRNGVEISNLQNFLVSMISTSILNKKKIHDIGCTPLFELGWNDPHVIFATALDPIFSYQPSIYLYLIHWATTPGEITGGGGALNFHFSTGVQPEQRTL